ncbi:MAG: hypothetical protein NTV24_05045 [Candidatus Woesebacteria bacterium]|nr:hypothetical protein [Candidatus Woesebacteria bacterium]
MVTCQPNFTTIENKILNNWVEKLTHNLTFVLKDLTLAGKMGNEFDRLFDAAEEEKAQKDAKEMAIQETGGALESSKYHQSWERVSKLLFPKLELRVQKLWRSRHGEFILGLTKALIRKIETKENTQQLLRINHLFYSQVPNSAWLNDKEPILYYNNDETITQRRADTGGEERRWKTFDKKYLVDAENPYYCWSTKLDKYQPSDLALEADIGYGSGTISFSFDFTEKGIIKPKYGFSENETFDINKVELDEVIKLFVQSAINRSYYHPPSYEPPWHDRP